MTDTTTLADALPRLKQAFTTALELPAEADHATLAYRETAVWDSLAHMQIVLAIETEFGIMLETEDVLALSSFPVACEILRRYGIPV
ncbi:MAG: acyl carrier protein [Gemmatimonadaceae bacterium]|jgi:acyl carrier protein|nr:acyl carrier protein [Gemmatimonadaceae bacterium]